MNRTLRRSLLVAEGTTASIQANGASMSYTYDSLNRLSSVTDSRLGTTTYTYDGASDVSTVTYPNGFEAAGGPGPDELSNPR